MNTHFFLFQFPSGTLIPNGKRIIWDSRRGFIIHKASYREVGLLTCETTVNGHLYKSNYLIIRQSKWCSGSVNVRRGAQGLIYLMKRWFFFLTWLLMLTANTITDVVISTPGPVRQLRGHTLTLNCTATTPLNTRVEMTWSYPGGVSDLLFYFFYRTVFSFCKWDAKLSFWSKGEKAEYSDAAGRVNKGALGLVRVLLFPDVLWVWSAEIPSFDVWRFCLEVYSWYFYCMILGGKGDCFILGNESLGFRDEKESYHNMPGRGYLL